MKVCLSANLASVLMISLVTSAVLIIGLGSYLALVQSQSRSVIRSQAWNAAIPAAEAGVEDALTHLNVVGDGSRATNGWVWTNNQFFLSRTSTAFQYSIGIGSSNQPSVYSTGYVRAPKGTNLISRIIRVTTTRFGAGMRGMIALGNITMVGHCEADSFDGGDPLYSVNGHYDVTKRKDQSYVGSVTGSIDTGGGKIYGSVATGASGSVSGGVGTFAWLAGSAGIQAGHYQNDLNVSFPPVSAPFNGGASFPEAGVAVVTTNYSYTSSLITTNVYPNPVPAGGVTSGTASYSSATYPSGQSGIVTNTVAASSMTSPAVGIYIGNIVKRVVTSGPPANRGVWFDYQKITGYNYTTVVYSYSLTSTNLSTSTMIYNYVLRSGNYQMSTLSMSAGQTMIIVGDATLYVPGNLSIDGQLYIAPGGSLKLYVGGASASMAGNGASNQSGDATKLSYYGLPSNTAFSLSGNASFTGSIYAPSADFSLNGGGNDNYDIVGAIVTKSVSMNGHFNFHYDERLGRVGGAARYRIASWDEL